MGSDPGGRSVGARIVPDAIRRRFVAKFFVSVLVVMLVTGAVGAYFFGEVTGTLTDRTESQLESTAQLQANGLDRWVEGLRHQTRLVSQAPAFRSKNVSQMDYHLFQQAGRYREDVEDVHVVSADSWTVLTSTTDDVEGRNLSAAGVPWASERGERVGRTTNRPAAVYVTSAAYESPASGTRVMAFVSAPPTITDQLVVVEANLSACSRSFDQPDEAAFTTVHGADGEPVCGGAGGPGGFNGTGGASGTGGSGGSGTSASSAPETALSANGSGFVTAEETVIGHAKVGATGWTVLTHVPKSAAYGLRSQMGTTILALVLVPLVALGVVAVVVGRRAGGELDRLTDHARAMREGDLDVEVDTSRPDEFGALARGFAEMRDALKQQIQEAEQTRKEAEVSRAEAVEMNAYLRERAEEYSDVLAACARGDLTRRMEPDGRHEAMDRIAEDFNETIHELELTTGQLKQFADEVGEGSQSVHESALTVRDASEQVAESVQQIADAADEETERLETVAAEIDAVASTLADLDERHPELSFAEPLQRIRAVEDLVDDLASASETVMAESETVAGAAEEQAAELTEVSNRALELRRTATHLGEGIDRFETEQRHEFVFQTGAAETGAPDSGAAESDAGPDGGR